MLFLDLQTLCTMHTPDDKHDSQSCGSDKQLCYEKWDIHCAVLARL